MIIKIRQTANLAARLDFLTVEDFCAELMAEQERVGYPCIVELADTDVCGNPCIQLTLQWKEAENDEEKRERLKQEKLGKEKRRLMYIELKEEFGP